MCEIELSEWFTTVVDFDCSNKDWWLNYLFIHHIYRQRHRRGQFKCTFIRSNSSNIWGYTFGTSLLHVFVCVVFISMPFRYYNVSNDAHSFFIIFFPNTTTIVLCRLWAGMPLMMIKISHNFYWLAYQIKYQNHSSSPCMGSMCLRIKYSICTMRRKSPKC